MKTGTGYTITTGEWFGKCVRHYDGNSRLHNDHGPAEVWKDGSYVWYFHGEKHRSDGPAEYRVTSFTGDEVKEWFFNGKQHRLDGPALIWGDKLQSWWIDGVCYGKTGHTRGFEEARDKYLAVVEKR